MWHLIERKLVNNRQNSEETLQFIRWSNKLHSHLLQKVTQRMNVAGSVSGSVNKSPNFNNLMKEYGVVLKVCRDCSKFITFCWTFITILSDQGGLLKMVSEVIADDWDKEIKEQLHISLNFTHFCYIIYSLLPF